MAQTASLPTTFDDWVAQFGEWQRKVGFDTAWLGDYRFEAKYDAENVKPLIEFGDYKGRPKWERPLQIPHQNIRDALLHLITVQGDTEFASVEQQRHLLASAPTEYDRKSALRIMAEEQRHGWQMCHLLMEHFGPAGAREAQKLLQRDANDGNRILGSFNEPTKNWLDFFVFTQFVDRDGKYQLKMLSHSAFKPLAASMGPMLKEESFHLGTGANGLRRIVKAGRVPRPAPGARLQPLDPHGLRPVGQGRQLLLGVGLRLGPQGPLRRGEARGQRRRPGQAHAQRLQPRSEERRVGKECRS